MNKNYSDLYSSDMRILVKILPIICAILLAAGMKIYDCIQKNDLNKKTPVITNQKTK